MVKLKELMNKNKIHIPSWVTKEMLNIDIMKNPYNIYPEIIDYYTKKNEYSKEHEEEVIITGRLSDTKQLFRITITPHHRIEGSPLVEMRLGNLNNFNGRPALIQYNIKGEQLLKLT